MMISADKNVTPLVVVTFGIRVFEQHPSDNWFAAFFWCVPLVFHFAVNMGCVLNHLWTLERLLSWNSQERMAANLEVAWGTALLFFGLQAGASMRIDAASWWRVRLGELVTACSLFASGHIKITFRSLRRLRCEAQLGGLDLEGRVPVQPPRFRRLLHPGVCSYLLCRSTVEGGPSVCVCEENSGDVIEIKHVYGDGASQVIRIGLGATR